MVALNFYFFPDSAHLKTAILSSQPSATEGSTVVLTCQISNASDGIVPLNLMHGWNLSWSLLNQNAWGQKTISVPTTIGSLGESAIVTESLPNGEVLTAVPLSDGSLLLPSVKAALLDGAAVSCHPQLRTSVPSSSVHPILLHVSKSSKLATSNQIWSRFG